MRMNCAAKWMRGGAWRARGLFIGEKKKTLRECDTMWMQIGFSICALLFGATARCLHRATLVQCAAIRRSYEWHWPRSFCIKLKSACRVLAPICEWRKPNDEIVHVIRWRDDWTQRYRCDHISCRIVSLFFSILHKLTVLRCCGHVHSPIHFHKTQHVVVQQFLHRKRKHSLWPAISATYLMRMTQWHDVEWYRRLWSPFHWVNNNNNHESHSAEIKTNKNPSENDVIIKTTRFTYR